MTTRATSSPAARASWGWRARRRAWRTTAGGRGAALRRAHVRSLHGRSPPSWHAARCCAPGKSAHARAHTHTHTHTHTHAFAHTCAHAHAHHRQRTLRRSVARVAAFPIGIDPERFGQALETEEVQMNIAKLLNRYAGRKVCARPRVCVCVCVCARPCVCVCAHGCARDDDGWAVTGVCAAHRAAGGRDIGRRHHSTARHTSRHTSCCALPAAPHHATPHATPRRSCWVWTGWT
jgi:hypothetical protein